MRIGIVGGTFNPIHVGHLMLGEYAYHECDLDEIWFMPNGNPPHKSADKIEISTDRRVDMIKLAIHDIEYFKLSAHELTNIHTSYSFRTLQELQELHPTHEYYFILGSDSLFNIESWRHPEKIFESCTILVACRENIDIKLIKEQILHLNNKYNGCIKLLPMPLLEISSSEIRTRISNKKSIKYIVPDCIRQYISEYNLYE